MTLVSSRTPPKNTKNTRPYHKVLQIELAVKIWQAPGLARLSFFRRLCRVYTDGKVDRTKASGCPKGSSDDLAFYVTLFSKKSPMQKMMTLVSNQNSLKNAKNTRHYYKVKRIKLAAKIW